MEIEVPDSPCDAGGGSGLTSTTLTPFVSNLPVAADGAFSFDGPDESIPANSHLQLRGRFSGPKVSATFSYTALYPSGDTCHTAVPLSFSGACIDCPQPGGRSDEGGGGSALTNADRFVPNRQIGRAPLGSTLAAFRARYPRDLWQGGHPDRRTGGRVSFFRPRPPLRARRPARPGADDHLRPQRPDLERVGEHLRPQRPLQLAARREPGRDRLDLAELRHAYPAVKCGEVGSSACSLVEATKPADRWTLFAFDRDIRRTSSAAAPARIRALTVQCLGADGCSREPAPTPPKPRR